MKKNRKRKMSVMTGATLHFGAVLGLLFAMLILHVLASSTCQQLMKKIGEDEKILSRLEDARNREAARWERMKTPERLEEALLRHGLSMKPPRADQNVQMKPDGTPYMTQHSVVQARRRNEGVSVRYKRGR